MSLTFGGRPKYPLLELTKANNITTRFDADAHFVTVICAREYQSVDAGADQTAKDRRRFCD